MPTLSTCQKKNFFCCDVSGIFARNVHTSSYSNDVKIILRIWHFSQWAENGCLMDGVATLCGTQRSGKILLNGAKNGCLKGLVGNGHSFCGRWNLQMKRVCLAAIAKVSHRKLPHVLIALLHIALLAPTYCKQACVLKCNVQGCVQSIAHYKSGSLTPTCWSEETPNSKPHTTHCSALHSLESVVLSAIALADEVKCVSTISSASVSVLRQLLLLVCWSIFSDVENIFCWSYIDWCTETLLPISIPHWQLL